MERFLSIENDLAFYDKYIMDLYFIIKEFGLSEEKAFGLDTSTVLVEKVPMIISPREEIKLQRIE
jgi:KUP system potassium uptake protein